MAFAHKEVLIQLQSTDTHGNTTFLNFKAAIRSASIPAFGKEEKKKNVSFNFIIHSDFRIIETRKIGILKSRIFSSGYPGTS